MEGSAMMMMMEIMKIMKMRTVTKEKSIFFVSFTAVSYDWTNFVLERRCPIYAKDGFLIHLHEKITGNDKLHTT